MYAQICPYPIQASLGDSTHWRRFRNQIVERFAGSGLQYLFSAVVAYAFLSRQTEKGPCGKRKDEGRRLCLTKTRRHNADPPSTKSNHARMWLNLANVLDSNLDHIKEKCFKKSNEQQIINESPGGWIWEKPPKRPEKEISFENLEQTPQCCRASGVLLNYFLF